MYYTTLITNSEFKNSLLNHWDKNSKNFDSFQLFSFPGKIGFLAFKGFKGITEKFECIGGIAHELSDFHYYPFKKSQLKKFIKYLKNSNDNLFIEFGLDWIEINKEFEIKFT